MIVRGQQADAIERGNADLDPAHAHGVEEDRHLRRARAVGRKTLASLDCAPPLLMAVLQLHAVVPQGSVRPSRGGMTAFRYGVAHPRALLSKYKHVGMRTEVTLDASELLP
jgi:hypothetical protein